MAKILATLEDWTLEHPKMSHAAPFEPVVTEEQRAALALAYCSTFRAERPIHELLREAVRLGEAKTAGLLCCHSGFVISWFPRRLPDGRIDSGWEPSGGFIGAALAILRSNASGQPHPTEHDKSL